MERGSAVTTAGPGPTTGVSVWVDDHHPIFRRGLVASLSGAGFHVSGQSAHLDPYPSGEIDLLVSALSYAALGLLREIRGPAIIGITADDDTALAVDALDSGVRAVLPRKELTPKRIVTALQSVHEGGTVLPFNMVPSLLKAAANGNMHSTSGLTERELNVLRLLADGEDTREIASSLCYSERTVKNVVHDVLMKMNCRNRAHAAAIATKQGLI